MNEHCPHQEELDALLAQGHELPEALQAHVDACPECQSFVAESRMLNQLLQEPLGMPPVDLTERIMAALEPHAAAAPPLRVWERLAWAALGSVVTLALQSAPWDAVASGWQGLMALADLRLPELTWSLPGELAVSWALPSLAVAVVLQFLITARLRKEVL